jgi:amino acid transporter
VCLAGGGRDNSEDGTPYGHESLADAFKDSSRNPYSYASAMLSVLFAYEGWENANYVLAEVKRPGGNVADIQKGGAVFFQLGHCALRAGECCLCMSPIP